MTADPVAARVTSELARWFACRVPGSPPRTVPDWREVNAIIRRARPGGAVVAVRDGSAHRIGGIAHARRWARGAAEVVVPDRIFDGLVALVRALDFVAG